MSWCWLVIHISLQNSESILNIQCGTEKGNFLERQWDLIEAVNADYNKSFQDQKSAFCLYKETNGKCATILPLFSVESLVNYPWMNFVIFLFSVESLTIALNNSLHGLSPRQENIYYSLIIDFISLNIHKNNFPKNNGQYWRYPYDNVL